VAEEVRALAQRSAQAAKETAEKIADSVRKSEHGVQISDRVARHFAEIVEKARQVDTLVAEIATASHEQTQGIAQVNSAVSQMDKVTHVNATDAEKSATSAEELNTQAVALTAQIGQLLALIEGKHNPNSRAQARAPHSDNKPPKRRNDKLRPATLDLATA
jgi:methyl-accepting chemotaxis protein